MAAEPHFFLRNGEGRSGEITPVPPSRQPAALCSAPRQTLKQGQQSPCLSTLISSSPPITRTLLQTSACWTAAASNSPASRLTLIISPSATNRGSSTCAIFCVGSGGCHPSPGAGAAATANPPASAQGPAVALERNDTAARGRFLTGQPDTQPSRGEAPDAPRKKEAHPV